MENQMSSPEQERNGDALDAEYKLVQPSPEDVPGIATYRSLARLLTGAALEGGLQFEMLIFALYEMNYLTHLLTLTF
jgi:hypothetical protein